MTVRLLAYTPDRREEIVSLMNASLGRTEEVRRDVAYWQWKHEQNPFGPSIVLLAEVDGRLAGMRAFMRWRLRAGDTTIQVAKPVDSVTHPDFQRRGIFTQLTTAACEQAAQQEIRLLFNTPNHNSLPGYLKLGWQKVGQLPIRVRMAQPRRAVWRLLRGVTISTKPQDARQCFTHTSRPAADVLADLEAIETLVAYSLHGTQRLHTPRDAAFLRWRYMHHPHLRYYAETVQRGDVTVGVVFFRDNARQGLAELLIDDVIYPPEEPEVLWELIAKVRQITNVDYLVLHCGGGSPAESAVRRAGFYRVPGRRIQLVCRVLENGFAFDPLQVENWALCFGDLEGL